MSNDDDIVKDFNGPTMFYHPKDGAYVICGKQADVPDGFVDDPADCEDDVTCPHPYKGQSMEATADEPKAKSKAKPKAKAPKAEKKAAKKASKKEASKEKAPAEDEEQAVTLKDLDISRADAVAMLDEEKVEFDVDASDDEIAAMVEELLNED